MSSDGFAVDLGVLRGARDRIGRLAEELAGPPRDVPGAGVLGHAALAEAVTRFADREERGLALLTSEAESCRHGLTETIRTYQKADEDGADLFRGTLS